MLTTASCWLELTIPSFTSIWLLAPHKHVGCTCCIFGNDWVFQSYVPCKQKSQVATPDCHLRWRGNHQAFAFNLLAQSGLVMQYHGHKQLRGEYQNGGQWHLPRIEYQLWCTWRYLNYNSLIFSLPYSLILSRVCRHGLSRKWRVKMPAKVKLVHP